MPRTLPSMKAVSSNGVLCKELTTMGIPMLFRWFSSSSLAILKEPTTVGITVALTSHNFCNCNLRSWYLVIFFSKSFTLIFWSSRTAMSMMFHSLFSLSMTSIFGLQCSMSLSVWISKSQSILILSFSSTGSGWYENHLYSHSISIFLHISQCTFFQVSRASSCIGFHLGQNTNEHMGDAFNLHSLYRGNTSWWSMPFFIAFVLSACSWEAHIMVSVSRFNSLAFSHCHLLWSCIPPASFRNWPWNVFFFQDACLSLSHSSLFFPLIFVLSCNSLVEAFRNLSLLFAA